jgi:hypothetical protein
MMVDRNILQKNSFLYDILRLTVAIHCVTYLGGEGGEKERGERERGEREGGERERGG